MCLAVLLAAWGCGSSERPYEDHSQDPDAYARTIKTLITSQLAAVKESKEPEDVMSAVVSELENYPNNPTGSHKDTYAQLAERCKELKDMFAQGGNRNAINAKIGEIMALADTLPGQAHVDKVE